MHVSWETQPIIWQGEKCRDDDDDGDDDDDDKGHECSGPDHALDQG